MSDEKDTDSQPPPKAPPTLAMQNTPNAERYVLEADAMRRRQMRSALLHGSRKTWREHQRVWPAVVVGLIVVGVIIAGIAVMDAFRVTQENQREQEREQEQPPATAPADPGAQEPGGSDPTPQPQPTDLPQDVAPSVPTTPTPAE
ncbi:hypothetical protein ACHAAC_16590 [Aeromicrobium sp. CF4.19]|uniref:hypothetical protein n=1 Tax=Aeromicrobium sp. CF4.19 TaxID=3373082 RepID=UPI003EE7F8DB